LPIGTGRHRRGGFGRCSYLMAKKLSGQHLTIAGHSRSSSGIKRRTRRKTFASWPRAATRREQLAGFALRPAPVGGRRRAAYQIRSGQIRRWPSLLVIRECAPRRILLDVMDVKLPIAVPRSRRSWRFDSVRPWLLILAKDVERGRGGAWSGTWRVRPSKLPALADRVSRDAVCQ